MRFAPVGARYFLEQLPCSLSVCAAPDRRPCATPQNQNTARLDEPTHRDRIDSPKRPKPATRLARQTSRVSLCRRATGMQCRFVQISCYPTGDAYLGVDRFLLVHARVGLNVDSRTGETCRQTNVLSILANCQRELVVRHKRAHGLPRLVDDDGRRHFGW